MSTLKLLICIVLILSFLSINPSLISSENSGKKSKLTKNLIIRYLLSLSTNWSNSPMFNHFFTSQVLLSLLLQGSHHCIFLDAHQLDIFTLKIFASGEKLNWNRHEIVCFEVNADFILVEGEFFCHLYNKSVNKRVNQIHPSIFEYEIEKEKC